MINDLLGIDGAGYPVVVGYERDAEGRPVCTGTGEYKPGPKGMALTLNAVDYGVKAGFGAWLLQLGRQDVLEWRTMSTPEEMGHLMADFSQRKTAGVYDWLGPVWQQKLRSEAGLKKMLYLLTRQHHPQLLPDEIDRLVEDNLEDVSAAVSEVIDAGNRQGHLRGQARRWLAVVAAMLVKKGVQQNGSPKSAASSPASPST